MQTIFCIEDDESIRELIGYALRSSGFAAEGFEDGAGFAHAMENTTPDLILLDIMLPGQDGLTILRQLRADPKTARIPVILLTAKTTEYDKVHGLDLGADDYVTKPFGVMELISRIKAVLRRTSPPKEDTVLRCGALELDPSRRTVTVSGNPVTLTYKEFELLTFLLKNKDLVLRRDKIMEMVWGFDFEGESRTVDMHIKSLRQKLGPCGALVQTVRGVGYKIGEVGA